MEAIIFGANLALLLSSAVSGLWAFKARQRAAGAAVMLGVWALGCAFIACAIAGQWLPAAGGDLEVLQRMAGNLAVYAALPLMAITLFALGRRLFWSAAGWGRLLLGLFALFELTRQLGYGNGYLQLLGLACCGGTLAAALRLARAAKVSALAGTLALGVGCYFYYRAGTHGEDPVAFKLLAALALLLLTTAIRTALAQRPAAAQPGDAQ